MPLILSVGSINVDFLFSVERSLCPGETLLAQGFLRTSGGKAPNRAVQACRLGASARLLGCVGDDELAQFALAGPAAAGVDIAAVAVTGPTGVSAILVEESGEKSIVLAANANDAWPSDYSTRVAEAMTSPPSRSVLACDFEVTPGAPGDAIRAAAQRGLTVVVDPSPADRADPQLWADVDHVTPNAKEAAGLTEMTVDSATTAAGAGRKLVQQGVGVAYVKLPNGGCVVVQADGADLLYDAPEVQEVDATGAGDSFAGALAVALAEGRSPADAALWAVAAASCSVRQRGSQESYAGRDEVEQLVSQVRRRPLPPDR